VVGVSVGALVGSEKVGLALGAHDTPHIAVHTSVSCLGIQSLGKNNSHNPGSKTP
jgi:hypothetical protein